MLTFVFLALFAVCSSNIALDITPPIEVVATGIVALLPSEEVTVTVVVLVLTPKFVLTLVFLAVLAAIALLIELANLSAVTPSLANCVVPTPPSVICMSSALAVIPVPPTTFNVAGPSVAPPVRPAPATTEVISPVAADNAIQSDPL